MAKLLIWVLALGCFAEAAKRCASTFEEKQMDKGVPKRLRTEKADVRETPVLERDPPVAEPKDEPQAAPTRMLTRGLLKKNLVENCQAPQFTLYDILGIIVCKIIEGFELRPKSDPICHLASVSRQWHAFFKSQLFWDTIIATPSAALHVLMTGRMFAPEFSQGILGSAKTLLLEEEQLSLLVCTRDPIFMIGLGELNYGEPIGSVLELLYRQLRIVMPAEFLPKGNWKKPETFKRKLEVLLAQSYERPPEEYTLMRMAPTDMMRLFYLEDLESPTTMNWLYPFFAQQVCQLYHRYPEFHLELTARMRELSRVTLPRSRTNLVFECMCYTMFMAAFAKDFKFLRILGLDYGVLKNLYQKNALLIGAIEEFHEIVEERQTQLTLKMVSSHQLCLNSMIELGTCGFDETSIKQVLQEVLSEGNLGQGLRQQIQRYIFTD